MIRIILVIMIGMMAIVTLMFIVMMIILEIGDCKAGWRKKIF